MKSFKNILFVAVLFSCLSLFSAQEPKATYDGFWIKNRTNKLLNLDLTYKGAYSYEIARLGENVYSLQHDGAVIASIKAKGGADFPAGYKPSSDYQLTEENIKTLRNGGHIIIKFDDQKKIIVFEVVPREGKERKMSEEQLKRISMKSEDVQEQLKACQAELEKTKKDLLEAEDGNQKLESELAQCKIELRNFKAAQEVAEE